MRLLIVLLIFININIYSHIKTDDWRNACLYIISGHYLKLKNSVHNLENDIKITEKHIKNLKSYSNNIIISENHMFIGIKIKNIYSLKNEIYFRIKENEKKINNFKLNLKIKKHNLSIFKQKINSLFLINNKKSNNYSDIKIEFRNKCHKFYKRCPLSKKDKIKTKSIIDDLYKNNDIKIIKLCKSGL